MFRKIYKFALFVFIFYILCIFTAFFVRDDDASYTRLMFKEFYRQDGIDMMVCGASHVSHGLYPKMMDEELGLKTFCTGTPSQRIDGTFFLIREAASLYQPKEIWLEMDFTQATRAGIFSKSKPERNVFLVQNYINNPFSRLKYIMSASAPKYWLNSLCPIGIESLIDLNPRHVVRRVKNRILSFLGRENYHLANGAYYAGKGSVFESDYIENGTFTSGIETPIGMDEISFDFEKTIYGIINFCSEKNIKLNFFAQPQSDFYLVEQGNYDEYYSYISDLIGKKGYHLYDFNLLSEKKCSFSDDDFFDDNHLNEKGMRKFTSLFCEFYRLPDEERNGYFCSSYESKLQDGKERVLGLQIENDLMNNFVRVIPVMGHGDFDKISFDIYCVSKDGKTAEFNSFRNDNELKLECNSLSSGEFVIDTYYGAEKQHSCTVSFSWL